MKLSLSFRKHKGCYWQKDQNLSEEESEVGSEGRQGGKQSAGECPGSCSGAIHELTCLLLPVCWVSCRRPSMLDRFFKSPMTSFLHSLDSSLVESWTFQKGCSCDLFYPVSWRILRNSCLIGLTKCSQVFLPYMKSSEG